MVASALAKAGAQSTWNPNYLGNDNVELIDE
jgi:hypothetical protein